MNEAAAPNDLAAWTTHRLLHQFRGLTEAEFLSTIGDARIKRAAKQGTPMTQALLATETVLSKLRTIQLKERAAGVYYLADGKFPNYPDDFEHLDQLIGEYWDPSTSSLMTLPMTAAIDRGMMLTHTFILEGDAGMGKTRLALALAAVAAIMFRIRLPGTACDTPPELQYFLFVKSVDVLKTMNPLMAPFVPIVLDEMNPNDQQLGLVSVDACKCLLDIPDPGSMRSRFHDAEFAENQFRRASGAQKE